MLVHRHWRLVVSVGVVLALALAVALVVSGLGDAPRTATGDEDGRPGSQTTADPGDVAPGGGSLGDAITAAQDRLRRLPQDYQTWGELGLAYVQQAKNTVNPMYYPKAEGALHRSLSIKREGNYVAMTGMASLEAGRHNFHTALTWARRATRANPYSASAWGIKSDALLQLGRYQQAFQAIQKENDLQPGAPAFARASYAWELRGNLERARATMRRALDDASTPPDRAFARYYLGELAFNAGRPKAALGHYKAGLDADPDYPALTEGKAKAEWALGRHEAALRDFADLVSRAPQPGYVMEYGEVLESLGHTEQARRQYDLFSTEQRLFEANGVSLDLDLIRFQANHGDPEQALATARRGVRQRPFLEVQDALAWALYRNGKYAAALDAEQKAMSLGMRNARFFAHAGLIKKALGRDDAARRDLARALEINPWFHPLQAPKVRQALAELGGPA